MAFSINNNFGILPAALELHESRAKVLAQNLANQDTPGFKARDLDFRNILQEQKQIVSGKVDGFGLSLKDNITSDNLLYRNTVNPKIDQNTVDSDIEKMEFSDNSLRYMANLKFLTGRIQNLMLAIRGSLR